MSPTPQELGQSLQNKSGPDRWGSLPREQVRCLNEIERSITQAREAMAKTLEIEPGKLLLEALVVEKRGYCVHPVFRPPRSAQEYHVGGGENLGIPYRGTDNDAGFLVVDWGLSIGKKRYPRCPRSGKLVVRSEEKVRGAGLYCSVPIPKTHESKEDMWKLLGDFMVPLSDVGELLGYTGGRVDVIEMINMGLKQAGGKMLTNDEFEGWRGVGSL